LAHDDYLMEVATTLLDLSFRRLPVTEGNKIVGVTREQDLFFEIATIMTQHRRRTEFTRGLPS